MYIVTGISRGLGKALVELLLKQNETIVGIGRSNPFGHRITFYACDLSDPNAIAALEVFMEDSPVTLINNAGIIGDIGRISEKDHSDLEAVMQVNVFAPMALTRKLYHEHNPAFEFCLVNISSGAANRSIPSWASYCASKAALNRLTENFYLEEQERDRRVKAYAIAPGVIDTDMQVEIRSADPEQFSGHENFVRMKEEGALLSPQESASRILAILKLPYNGTVFQDVRDV